MKFRWSKALGCFCRVDADMTFQHNHELAVKEKCLLQNDAVIKEINLYMDC